MARGAETRKFIVWLCEICYSRRMGVDPFNLQGKAGLIVGGAGKMGLQFAESLSDAGADVMLADLEIDRAQPVGSRNAAGRVAAFKMDVTSERSVEEGFAQAQAQMRSWGRSLDFLVYNVMAKPPGYYRDFENYDRETWNSVIAGNLTGAFHCAQKATALMRPQRSGSMVFTASIYGVVAPDQRIYAGMPAQANPYGGSDPLCTPGSYPASKGGLIAFARYLSTLLGPDGIRVNVLTPGGVQDGQDPKFIEAYASRVPLGRMANWQDFNGAIRFLVSPASRYVTGTNLVVDGGWTAW
jgi:NAD(P)-dependent dehydrogenase (short-subunit alcohol dehydrogenase family)